MCCGFPSFCCYPPMPTVSPMGFNFGYGCSFPPISYNNYGFGGFYPTYNYCNYQAANLGWNTGAMLGMGVGALLNRYC